MLLAGLFATGCGDNCVSLCRDVSFRLNDCRGTDLTWADLGARNRSDFVDECRADWEKTRSALSSSDQVEALDVCDRGTGALSDLDCDELRALYAPLP